MHSWKSLLFCNIFVNLIVYYDKKTDAQGLTKFYEYGAHLDGDKLSFQSQGVIAEFVGQADITMNSKVKGLEHSYTYIRVNYDNYLSDVDIQFDPKTNTMHFKISLPFFQTQYEIIGYSMPIRSHIARIGEQVISNLKHFTDILRSTIIKVFG